MPLKYNTVIMGEKKKVLWVDPDHMWCWKGTLDGIEKRSDFEFTRVDDFNIEDIVSYSVDKSAVVIHPGTFNPRHETRRLINEIKEINPAAKIGLETSVRHPDTDQVIDFYVCKPIMSRELIELLSDVTNGETE